MLSGTYVQRLLLSAVELSTIGDEESAIHLMREALEHEFDTRVASAIHRLEQAAQGGGAVDLRELLVDVLPADSEVQGLETQQAEAGAPDAPLEEFAFGMAEEFTIDVEEEIPLDGWGELDLPSGKEARLLPQDPAADSDFDFGPDEHAIPVDEVVVEEVSLDDFARAVATDPARSSPAHASGPTSPLPLNEAPPADRSARARYQATAPPPPAHRRGLVTPDASGGVPDRASSGTNSTEPASVPHGVPSRDELPGAWDEVPKGDTYQGPNPLAHVEADPLDEHFAAAVELSRPAGPTDPAGTTSPPPWEDAGVRPAVADPFAWAEEPYRRENFDLPQATSGIAEVSPESRDTEPTVQTPRLDATVEVEPFSYGARDPDRRPPQRTTAKYTAQGADDGQEDQEQPNELLSSDEPAMAPMPGANLSVEEQVAEHLRMSREARDRGDLAIALRHAEDALEFDAGSPEALSQIQGLKRQFLRIKMAQLEPLERVPFLNYARVGAVRDSLNQRLVFLFQLVDGVNSLQDIIDLSGMPASEVVDSLLQLVELQLLAFHGHDA